MGDVLFVSHQRWEFISTPSQEGSRTCMEKWRSYSDVKFQLMGVYVSHTKAKSDKHGKLWVLIPYLKCGNTKYVSFLGFTLEVNQNLNLNCQSGNLLFIQGGNMRNAKTVLNNFKIFAVVILVKTPLAPAQSSLAFFWYFLLTWCQWEE